MDNRRSNRAGVLAVIELNKTRSFILPFDAIYGTLYCEFSHETDKAMTTPKKVLVLGLDCAAPQLVFNRWKEKLPHLSALMHRGLHGPLSSCIPPITIPAWSCMMSSKSPGTLGCYGFRNRNDHSYNGLSFATSNAIREDRVWDILSRHDRRVLLIGIPQTYPPKPVQGCMVSGFLTPDTTCRYTYPENLAREITDAVGEYIIDVDDFRSDDKDAILKQAYAMTEQRFALLTHFLQTKPWDFAMMVDMGIDRIHHAFWKFMDSEHPQYRPDSAYADTILEYYRFIDNHIGKVLALVDDNTAVLVVSDHGAQALQGGFCINEWLIQENYLTLESSPDHVTPLSKCSIDWSKTRAWAEGGYYSRIWLNVEGREPQGTILPQDYEPLRDRLIERLEATTDPAGKLLGTKAYRPEDMYSTIEGIPPDLMVFFGDMKWRAIGSVGHNALHTFKNDIGPDDANHARDGICIVCDPARSEQIGGTGCEGLTLLDIAPTILDLMGIPIPEDMEGTSILHKF